MRQSPHKRLGLGVDFGQIVVFAFDFQRRAQLGRAVLPVEVAFSGDDNAAFVPVAFHPRQQLHRHRVQHLVANDNALHRVWQLACPTHFVAKMPPTSLAGAAAERQTNPQSCNG